MTLVLFPLSAHLLPGGIMPLRIFEPRYQRMIAESREREFALCMLDPRQPDALRNMYPIATRVRIIDFDLLPDGLLGITVLGVERVRITDLWQEEDGLRVGEVEPLPPGRAAGSRRISTPWPGVAGRVQRLSGVRGPLSGAGLGGCELGRPALAGGAAHPGGTKAVAGGGQGQPAHPSPCWSGLLVASH